VVLANGRLKCGACDFGGSTELVHLVGVSISLEKNFYQLPFTPPLSGHTLSFYKCALASGGEFADGELRPGVVNVLQRGAIGLITE
jgi:hypothetical protein